MKVVSQDIFTPANVLTLTGFGLSTYGAWHLTTLAGVLIFGSGRMLDMADGFVARRTRASELGALLDASADKFVMTFVVIAAWLHHIVPVVILAFIVLQNVLNTIAYFYSTHLEQAPKPVRAGKFSHFAQVWTLGFFALAQFGHHGFWVMLGWIEFVGHLPLAFWASSRYWLYALQSRTGRKANSTTDNGKR